MPKTGRIIPRKKWDHDPNPRYGVNWISGPLIVHHTVIPKLPADASYNQAMDRARRIDDIHEGFGWSGGFGYNFGTIAGWLVEGRGAEYRGAHTVGYNSLLPACVVDGDYSRERPDRNDLDNLVWLARHLGRNSFTGHRDYNATGCPGDNLFSVLNALTKEIEDEGVDLGRPKYFVEAESFINGGIGVHLLGGWGTQQTADKVYNMIRKGEGTWGKIVEEQGASISRVRFDVPEWNKAPYGIIVWPRGKYGMGNPVWGPFEAKDMRHEKLLELRESHPDVAFREYRGRQNSIYSRRP